MTTPEVRLFQIAFGALVTHLREKRDMTQAELAAKLDVTQPTVARIENGKNRVPVSKYMQLTEVFGMTLDQFHGRVQQIIDATHRAAEAIKPGSMDRVEPRKLEGLVLFVVKLLTARESA